jgi:hypothetical protein
MVLLLRSKVDLIKRIIGLTYENIVTNANKLLFEVTLDLYLSIIFKLLQILQK